MWTMIAGLWIPKESGTLYVAKGNISTACSIILEPGMMITIKKNENRRSDKSPDFILEVAPEREPDANKGNGQAGNPFGRQ